MIENTQTIDFVSKTIENLFPSLTHTHTHARILLQVANVLGKCFQCDLPSSWVLPLTNFAPTWRAAKKRGKRINNFAIGAKARKRWRERERERRRGLNCISYFCKLQHMPHEDSAQKAEGRSKQTKNTNNIIIIIIWGIPLLCLLSASATATTITTKHESKGNSQA